MATKKFKKNLISMLNLFDSKEELVDFLSKKKAFSEDFIKQITDSDYLKKLHRIDPKLDVDEIKRKLHYEISYNKKSRRISVDITKNDVFSYLETEDELIQKMKNYIINEDYEKAQVLRNYFKTIELEY
jgi:acetylornithine deacetylase/succinyl-diaminopimelate desuccinylase-like protein